MQPLPERFTERLIRSLEHRIRLLHRSNSHFFILGATGNVYTVTLSAAPSCNCPDPTTPCKHILFLYIRVLSLSPDDPCLRTRTLRPCQLTRLLSAPVSSETVAGAAIRQRFHELYLRRIATTPPVITVEDNSTCPICLEEMGVGGRRLVACATCKNPIHEECLMAWKNRRSRTCVICRARWRNIDEEDRYINLSAYVSEDDEVAHNSDYDYEICY
ncbi:hypothetical protein Ccrd_007656 [Cynara cardunculus var. scolymus]|uniref:Uncharacterized protein n=1 Tax=Cynara cardunculus var. scolymus TaxID=59895 RepID=A0A103XGJ4_CYNCS|nr:hypothetical protein Ccrd_007656 [Cynara cardunculus var. scolymus]